MKRFNILMLHPSWLYRNPNCGAARDFDSIKNNIIRYNRFNLSALEWTSYDELNGVLLNADVIILYHSSLIDAAAIINKKCKAKLIIRASNAEALQKWDKSIASDLSLFSSFINASKSLVNDIKISFMADVVLSISEWETDHYWRFITNSKKILTVPYFSKDTIMGSKKYSYEGKPMSIISMQAANDPIAKCQREGLQLYENTLTRNGLSDKVELLVSRGEEVVPLPDLIGVKTVTFSNPTYIHKNVRAVALLSNRGYGIKTSAIDAISAGIWVLVHPRLLKRMPDCVSSACIPVDPNQLKDVAMSIEKLRRQPPKSALYGIMKLGRLADDNILLAIEG